MQCLPRLFAIATFMLLGDADFYFVNNIKRKRVSDGSASASRSAPCILSRSTAFKVLRSEPIIYAKRSSASERVVHYLVRTLVLSQLTELGVIAT